MPPEFHTGWFADALTEVRRALQLDFAEIGDHAVRSMHEQVWRARRGCDTDDKAEIPGASRFNASCRILEDCGTRRRRIETARSFQKHVRSRFPWKTESIEINAVYSCIEQRRQTGCLQNLRTMVAR